MAEVGIPYTFIGPAGYRAVLNDPADPDFVGYLDGENGITGLLDGAQVRENAADRVEADGGVHGAFWRSRRVGTIQGTLTPDCPIAIVLGAEQRLKLATRGIRGDVEMRWTPTSSAYERRLLLRRQGPVAITGRLPKQFQIPLASADHRVMSVTEQLQTILPGDTGGELGFTSPITDPFHTTFGSAGSTRIANDGDEDASWRAVLTGPLTNPVIVNNDTGEQLAITWTLGAGETLTIDQAAHTIRLGTGEDRYRSLNFAQSSWWYLPADTATDVRLLAQAYSAGARLDFYWRHAWE